MKRPMTFQITDEVRDLLKFTSVETGIPMTKMVEKAIINFLKENYNKHINLN